MLNKNFYDSNWKKNSSPSYSGTLMTPEMQYNVEKALHEIGGNRHVAVYAPPGMGATTFLENVIRQCRKEYPDKMAVYIPLADVNTEEEFREVFVNAIFNELSQNVSDLVDYAIENGYLKKGQVFWWKENDDLRHFIRLFSTDNIWESLDEAVNLACWLCDVSSCHMIVCLDDIERLEELDPEMDVVSIFLDYLWKLRRITIVSTTHSKNLYGRLVDEMDLYNCDGMEFTIPSDKSVGLIVREHLQTKSEDIPEECIKRLCDLCLGNISVGLELADAAMLLSNSHLSLTAIEEAFNYVLMHKKRLYRILTNLFSEDVQDLLEFLVKNSFESSIYFYGFTGWSESEQMILNELSEEGILIQNGLRIRFVDPLYREWLKSHFAQKYWPNQNPPGNYVLL